MAVTFDEKLVIGISSSALFDLREGDDIFRTQGLDAYKQYQIDNEDSTLEPGEAFHIVKKLLNINELLGAAKVEVVLLSRNSADSGLRVFNSINAHQLPITRAAFSGGQSPHRYAVAFGAHLFLSTNTEDVRHALAQGLASAVILPNASRYNYEEHEIRIAFDGDAVLFDDESERIYQEKGLEAFTENERRSAHQPMEGGPFKPFLAALHHLQTQFGQLNEHGKKSEESKLATISPIRTALVTARSAPAHERVVRTLRQWDIRIDESLFLGGMDKAEFLKSFGADIFFDDQKGHIKSASKHVTAGHVPHGVTNL